MSNRVRGRILSRTRTARSKRAHQRSIRAYARRQAEMVAAIDAELAETADPDTVLVGEPFVQAEEPVSRPRSLIWGYGLGPKQQAAEAHRKALATVEALHSELS